MSVICLLGSTVTLAPVVLSGASVAKQLVFQFDVNFMRVVGLMGALIFIIFSLRYHDMI